jgi:amino acid adenylation domain-containing protein
MTAITFIDVLRGWAEMRPDALAYRFLVDGETREERLTYAELDRRARAIAVMLGQQGALAEPGARALLLFPPGLDYLSAFFGCLYAGVIAVPAYPPDPARLARMLPRLEAIAADSTASLVLTTSAIRGLASMIGAQAPALAASRWLATDGVDLDTAVAWRAPDVSGKDIAFLQYTSGSTGTPKGVVLSHRNLLANSEIIHESFGHSDESHAVIWLPPYHDMGLIGGILQPLHGGFPATLLSPLSFLQEPMRWLRAVSRYRGTTSGGPNFAFELCVKRARPGDLAELDLSSWQVAFNGAEPIRPATLERFARTFAPCGFRQSAFYPCYGLAEATLIVTGQRRVVQMSERVEPTGASASARPAPRVASGRALRGVTLAIVDPHARTALAEGEVGEIWVRAESVGQGYYGRPEETREVFEATLANGDGPYLRTGDHGFVSDGDLYVTGRIKDLIIIRGRNLYPQDIEQTVEASHPAVRSGCVAAFSIDVPIDGQDEERLAVALEVQADVKPGEVVDIAAAIRRAISERHELSVHVVAMLRRGTIPKTSSGKIQRRACRAALLSGTLDVIGQVEAGAVGADEGVRDPEPAPITAEGLARLDADTRCAAIVEHLQHQAAALLGLVPGDVRPEQPLTAAGVDSLAAVELAAEVEQRLGVPLALTRFLDPTPLADIAAAIASDIDTHIAARTGEDCPPARDADVLTSALSPGQEALSFLARLDPESAAYNVALVARIHAPLDVAALRRALQIVVDRHGELQATFPPGGSGSVHKVLRPFALEVPVVDAAAWSGAALLERLRKDANAPFDLATGPLVRASLYRRESDEHVLLLAVHHVAVDLWSLVLLLAELRALYPAGDVSALPPAPGYARFLAHQRDVLAPARAERLWSYWRGRLAGPLPVLALPTECPRDASPTTRGAMHAFTIDAETTQALRRLAQRHGATLYMALLAAYQVLLARHARQSDVLVGAPASGRTSAELMGVVGYLANTVVLRADLSDDPVFATVLERARDEVRGALEHQDLPFSHIVEALAPRAARGLSPLFQAAFVMERPHRHRELAPFILGHPRRRLRWGALDVETLPFDQGTTQFELTLNVVEGEDELSAAFQFATDLHARPSIERMAEQLVALIRGAVTDPGRRVSELPLIWEAERPNLVGAWSRGPEEAPDRCVHELFAMQAARTPDAPAVTGEGRTLSYAELARRASQLAHHLVRAGVQVEERVAICMHRSPETIAAMLGVLQAGAAYAPIDPEYPADRIRGMLEDAGARIVLTQPELADKLRGAPGRLVHVSSDWSTFADEPGEPPLERVNPAHLAYVIFTSGSTGRPKAVMTTHRSASNYLQGMQAAFPMSQSDRALQVSAISFDASVSEIFTPLIDGALLVLAGRDEPRDAAAVIRRILADRITSIQMVPALLHFMVRESDFARCTSLQRIFCGGEGMPVELQDAVLERLSGVTLVNLYGPTEATVDPAHLVCRPGYGRGIVPVGRPSRGMQLLILDEAMQPVPVGVPGEAYFGGAGVARGYLGRPDLTAERFVPNPFGDVPGDRLYRSGDVARWLPDGNMEFLGRVDHQVKVRGFRIELGEIEAALARHPDVAQAVVVAHDDARVGRRLVGYVIGRDGQRPAATSLREHLARTLPEYMVPGDFVLLDALPLNVNGKVDRGRLQPPAPAAADEPLLPRDDIERTIAAVWAETLSLPRVGVHDDFFQLGGHSLLATRVVGQLRTALAVELSLRDLFEAPTVAGLAARARLAAPAASSLASAHLGRSGDRSLSFAQQRMWFLDQLTPGSTLYNVTGALRVRGHLDDVALERALAELVLRHESLRTVFPPVDGVPVQRVLAGAELHLERGDLCALDAQAREQECQRLLARAAAKPFDLARSPLLRVTLVRLASDEHLLVLSMHHIVTDGWSMGILIRELGELYAAFTRGEASPLAPLALQYIDVTEWQRVWLADGAMDEQLAYWKTVLAAPLPALELPADRARPAILSHRGAHLGLTLDGALLADLRRLAQDQGATLFMVLLSAFASLLHRYSQQTDLLVGTPIAGRTRPETESIIGCFVNTLVLRVDASGDPDFATLLGRVRDATVGAYTHQDVPFEKLVEEIEPRRDLGRTPLFQAMFVLQNAPMGELHLPGATLELIELESGTSKFDLTFVAEEVAGEAGDVLRLVVEYSTDLFEEATARRMSMHFEALLRAFVADPAVRIAAAPMLSMAERQALVRALDRTSEAGEGGLVHRLFETEVARAPGALAVVDGERRVTYGELDAQAERLAGLLAARGVGPGDRVGICLYRSIELVAALWGILKAGAAYVPIDPQTPRGRATEIARQAKLALLVTESALVESALAAGEASGDVDIVLVDRPAALAAASATAPARPRALSPDALAYLMFTSGSTGRPKGVMVPHRGLWTYLVQARELYRTREGNGAPVHSSIAFDLTVTSLLLPLVSGRPVVIVHDRDGVDGLVRVLQESQDLGPVKLTPAHLELLARMIPAPELAGRARCLVVGGEALPAPTAAHWRRHAPGTRLINEYGPTETVVGCCVHEVVDVDETRPVPIGRPLAGASLYVLDGELEPVPLGAIGELYIGGAGVAHGYADEPAVTAAAFLPDPYALARGARMYRTGDLARLRGDGLLEFVGRRDAQVKLRGYRVELGEIEAALGRQAGVREAAVVLSGLGPARDWLAAEPRLVGYVVGDGALDLEGLRAGLAEELPGYMLPAVLVHMSSLPLTRNGKVDRAALPAPEHDTAAPAVPGAPGTPTGAQILAVWKLDQRTQARPEHVDPRTPVENALAAIWVELLHLDRVGVHDSFFELGGHSLVAIQALARIRSQLHVDLPLRRLFESPTLAELAEAVTALARPDASVTLSPIVRIADDLPDDLHQHVDELSEDEVDRLLQELGDEPLAPDVRARRV